MLERSLEDLHAVLPLRRISDELALVPELSEHMGDGHRLQLDGLVYPFEVEIVYVLGLRDLVLQDFHHYKLTGLRIVRVNGSQSFVISDVVGVEVNPFFLHVAGGRMNLLNHIQKHDAQSLLVVYLFMFCHHEGPASGPQLQNLERLVLQYVISRLGQLLLLEVPGQVDLALSVDQFHIGIKQGVIFFVVQLQVDVLVVVSEQDVIIIDEVILVDHVVCRVLSEGGWHAPLVLDADDFLLHL